ncbi:Mu-like prophage I protein [Pseudomonas chlororaphis subsp. aurantiaca]|uniref:phage protease n=1 Tax=Pseudomonas chlororaphis TaxID=587753 RepID=UPI000864BFD5|nr:phage protease [Pseudomonas chlororaphis]BAV74117.1 Mu-like prophage I protein [Pseudomonas chlororaphis subsp. aurantiaca]
MKTQLALNSEIYSSVELIDGQAPDWVEIIPPGPMVVGRDGRRWLFDELAADLVQSSFVARAIDLPIDWEHATQRRASVGLESPASGWIKGFENRDGGLWAKVEWTPRGALQIESREYRFLSPVFDYETDSTRIVRMVSAALTNIPNFLLTALNQEQQEQPVKPSPELLKLLGLPESATAEQVFAATSARLQGQALNTEQQPGLDRFVPRADYNALEARAQNAEQALATHKKGEHNKAVDELITSATQAGKITPATVDYHRAMCQDEAGLQRFKEFVAAAPVVADASGLGAKADPKTATALNSEEQAVCRQLGLDPVEFAKSKQSEG